MSGAFAPSVRPTRAPGLYAFVFGVGALALLVGAVGLLNAVRGHDVAEAVAVAAAPSPSQVGRPIRTSFGVVSVDQVGTLKVRGVPAGKIVVQVAVTMTNLGRRPLPLASSQFSLRLGGDGPIVGVRNATLAEDQLGAGTARKTLLRFVVPRQRARLFLSYRDPRRERPVVIDAGSATKAATGPAVVSVHPGGPGHDH